MGRRFGLLRALRGPNQFDWVLCNGLMNERDLSMFWITATQTEFVPLRAFAEADEARAGLTVARDRIGTVRGSADDQPAP